MNVSVIEVVGLIGVVLVVSTGKVFNPLRDFLRSFTHPYNPSRWLADLISCSMCSGVWIGAVWALAHSWSWGSVVAFAGLLSVASFAANELLGLVGILTFRVSRGMTAPMGAQQTQESSVVALAQARTRARERVKPRKVAPGNDLSEEEADALLDQEEERADAMVSPVEDDQGQAA